MKKYTLAKKAYKIDLNRIYEGYYYCENSCFAENINQAKSILLKSIKYENYRVVGCDKDVDYLTIPVVRAPQLDLYKFELQELTLSTIEHILNERERIKILDDLLLDKSVDFCYIRKNGLYYRKNSSGYTEYISKAGIYSKIEAVSIAKGCEDIILENIDVQAHNEMINQEINDLQTRIISIN